MNFTNNLETTITCFILIILSIVFMYIIYRMLDYQRNPVKYREGFDSTGNCSISDLKNNITKLKVGPNTSLITGWSYIIFAAFFLAFTNF